MSQNKRQNEKYENMGLTGLANLGNTCFLNSCIQCLSHTYEFSEFLDKKKYMDNIRKEIDTLILIEWDKLRKLMWSENCVIRPSGFVKKVQEVAKVKDRVVFTGYAQNDLEEFLTFLIECFHNALFREFEMNILGDIKTKQDKLAVKCYDMIKTIYKTEYSEIIDLFYGIHVSKLSTVSNSYQNITPEPFCIVSLPIPNIAKPSILDCFNLYTKKEKLEGDNAIYNEKTKQKENATRQLLFWNLPKILICTLKRFSNNSRKNQKYVDFNLDDLDLSEYVLGYDNNSYKYELYGICNHQGSCLGGHYTAFVKNANGKWYFFNDTNVMEVKDTNKLKTPKAYCFFYRKKKIQ